MSYRPKMHLPQPESWIAFEDLCWGLWKCIWRHDGTKKNGRRGQPQHGVDVYGRPGNGAGWAGVQCKGKDSYTDKELKTSEIVAETQKARSFEPMLSAYIIATTAPRDQALQTFVRTLSDESVHAGWFPVDVCGWDDIVDLLYEHTPPVAAQYYPQVFGSELASLARQLLRHLATRQNDDSISEQEAEFRKAGGVYDQVENDKQVPRDTPITPDREIFDELTPEELRSAIDILYSIQQNKFSRQLDPKG